MKLENIVSYRQKLLFIGLAIFLALGLCIMLVTSGIGENGLLSQFSGANTSPSNAATQWQPTPSNTYRTTVGSLNAARLDGIVRSILTRGTTLNVEQFKAFLTQVNTGITNLAAKPGYSTDPNIQNIVGYITFELTDARTNITSGADFVTDMVGVINGISTGSGNGGSGSFTMSIYLTQSGTTIYPDSSMKFQLDSSKGDVRVNWIANQYAGCWLDYGYVKNNSVYSGTVNGGNFLPNTSSGILMLTDVNGGKLYDIGLTCGQSSVGYFNIPTQQTRHYFISWNGTSSVSQSSISQSTITPTAEQIANEKKMNADQALFKSKYYICYVEEKIWQKCDTYISDIGFGPTTYTNPKNTGCTERYKADSNGWALVYLAKNDVYRLSGWGCAQGYRKQYCRVGSRTEVSTTTIEQETGILGIRGTDIWSPSRVGYFTDRFTPSSNPSTCSTQVDSELYWRQDMAESGGILMPEITITRVNDIDSQTLTWTTTANTEKLAWECTGGGNQSNMMTNRTISNQNEALSHASTRTTWKEFQTNGWSAGTWNCTWKITGNGVVNTKMESFTIEAAPAPPTDPNFGMYGMKPKFTLSRTCDGTPCSTIAPGNISYGANWTTEKAQEVSFTCTGPTTSTQTGKKTVVELNMSTNFSKYQDFIDAGWTPGSYNCTWKSLGFDGSATLFTDTFTISG